MNTGYNEGVTRKAVHAARMASEVTGEEAVHGELVRVQVSREIEGDRPINVIVGHVTEISEVRETLHTVPVIHSNQFSLSSQLPPVESHNSRNLCINEGVTDLMEDLLLVQVLEENLFDFLINEIDANLNRFNEILSMKGKTNNALNECFNSNQKQNTHHNTRSTCKLDESPIMEFTHTDSKISNLQYTRNLTLMSIKRN